LQDLGHVLGAKALEGAEDAGAEALHLLARTGHSRSQVGRPQVPIAAVPALDAAQDHEDRHRGQGDDQAQPRRLGHRLAQAVRALGDAPG
jgi:hypothetical protein